MSSSDFNVIGEGSFGCVLRPPLECDSYDGKMSKEQHKTQFVSKLMKDYSAEDEMAIINSILPYVKKIKNYKDYFLVEDTSLCNVKELTDKQLKEYEKKCGFLSRDVKKSELNRLIREQKMKLLNIKYGGITLHDYTPRIYDEGKYFVELNKKLIDLINNAIVPLNKYGMIHNDVKNNNIVVHREKGELKVRLIDWGLNFEYDLSKSDKELVEDFKYGLSNVFQYNVPPTCYIFSKEFDAALKSLKEDELQFDDNMKNNGFVVDLIANRLVANGKKFYGGGHKEYLQSQFNSYIDIRLDEGRDLKGLKKYILFSYYLVQNIKEALKKYLNFNTFKFDKARYIREVLAHNIDIWDIIMNYMTISFNFYRNRKFVNAVFMMLDKYIFSGKMGGQKINIRELSNDLYYLNKFAGDGYDYKNYYKTGEDSPKSRELYTHISDDDVHKILSRASYVPKGDDRCKDGYRLDRSSSSKLCVKKSKPTQAETSIERQLLMDKVEYGEVSQYTPLPGKKCKRGYRKNTKTQKCVRRDDYDFRKKTKKKTQYSVKKIIKQPNVYTPEAGKQCKRGYIIDKISGKCYKRSLVKQFLNKKRKKSVKSMPTNNKSKKSIHKPLSHLDFVDKPFLIDPIKKKCPTGYVKYKKTGKCIRRKGYEPKTRKAKQSPKKDIYTPEPGKKCKAGYRKNTKIGKCVKKGVQISNKKSVKTSTKKSTPQTRKLKIRIKPGKSTSQKPSGLFSPKPQGARKTKPTFKPPKLTSELIKGTVFEPSTSSSSSGTQRTSQASSHRLSHSAPSSKSSASVLRNIKTPTPSTPKEYAASVDIGSMPESISSLK